MRYDGRKIEKDGTVKFFSKKVLHRELGPAVIYPNGEIEFWNEGKKLKTYKTKNGYIVINRVLKQDSKKPGTEVFWYNKEGRLHRKNDLPAIITYCAVTNSMQYEWYQNGKLHRVGNAAIEVHFIKNKQLEIFQKYYYQNNQLHNEEDAANIIFENGVPRTKFYYLRGYPFRNEHEFNQANRKNKLKKLLEQ